MVGVQLAVTEEASLRATWDRVSKEIVLDGGFLGNGTLAKEVAGRGAQASRCELCSGLRWKPVRLEKGTRGQEPFLAQKDERSGRAVLELGKLALRAVLLMRCHSDPHLGSFSLFFFFF